MSEFKEEKLGEILDFGNGKRKPKSEGDVPIYGGNGILGYSSESNYDGETIIIGRVGAYCGSVYYTEEPIWISDNALSAKPKNNYDTKFLYYFLKDLDLNQFAGGSSHPLVTQTLLNSLEITISDDVDEQKTIAEVLSSLDDKIDLLQRQNKTLEAMAETLFRQWFVKEVEEDWEEYKISDIAYRKRETVKPYEFPEKLFSHYSLPSFDESKKPVRELGSEIRSNKYQVIPRSVLVSKLNPRFPRIWAIEKDIDKASICSTEFQVYLAKEDILFPFLYNVLKSEDAKAALQMAASGTSGSHQRVRPDDISNITFHVPNLDKAREFSDTILPLIEKEEENRKQINILDTLRDTLLPKLMSGDGVRVKTN